MDTAARFETLSDALRSLRGTCSPEDRALASKRLDAAFDAALGEECDRATGRAMSAAVDAMVERWTAA